MLTEPGATRRPDAVVRVIDRGASSPEIEVVVCHPTACTIVFTSDTLTGLRKLFDRAEQRFATLGEVAWLGDPIVHFDVDVRRVFAVPGWTELIIPKSLQVGGLPAGSARSNHQVATELKKQSRQMRIVAVGKT